MIYFKDTTLREGDQSILISRDSAARISYLYSLFALGIKHIEVYRPMRSESDAMVFNSLLQSSEVAMTVYCGPLGTKWHEFRFGSALPAFTLTREHSSILCRATAGNEGISIIEDQLPHNVSSVRIGIENSFKLPPEDLFTVLRTLSACPSIHRIGICDSSGIATPSQVNYVLKNIGQALARPVPLEFHFHDDCGLASANFRELLLSDLAEREMILVDVSWCGVGERNGILSLRNALAIGLRHSERMNVISPLSLSALETVTVAADKLLPPELAWRDTISKRTYTHNASSHFRAKNTHKEFELICPELLGYTERT